MTGALRQLPGAAGCVVSAFDPRDALTPDASDAAGCARLDAIGPVAVGGETAFVIAGRWMLRLALRDGALVSAGCALAGCAAPSGPRQALRLAVSADTGTLALSGWLGQSVPALTVLRGAGR